MYRDDLRLKPARTLLPTQIPDGGIDDKVVVLVDDVLFSGPHDPRRPRRAERRRPAARGPARRPGRPRPPRAADPGRLRRQEPPDLAGPAGPGPPHRRRRRGRGDHRGSRRMKKHLLSAADLTRDDAELVLAHRRRDAVAGRPADQEAARAARPHGGQPLLRGLHPDPDLLRGRGQAALGRRHQLLRQGLVALQGRVAQGHRADPRGDGLRRGRHPARRQRRPAPAGQLRLGPRLGGQRRRRHPRAPDPGAARRLHHVAPPRGPQRRHPRRSADRHRRRRAPLAGGPLQRAAAPHARRRGHPGRPADPVPGGHRHLAGGDVVRPRRGAAQGRRRDDAAGPAGADERRVLPHRARVQPPLRPRRPPDGDPAGPHDRHAPRPDGPRHGDHRRRRRLATAR